MRAMRRMPVRVADHKGWSNGYASRGSDELWALIWSDDLKARGIVAEVSAVADHLPYLLGCDFDSARHIGQGGVTILLDYDVLVVRRMAQDGGQVASKAIKGIP